jgi:hypothetical protein
MPGQPAAAVRIATFHHTHSMPSNSWSQSVRRPSGDHAGESSFTAHFRPPGGGGVNDPAAESVAKRFEQFRVA